jgi:hypothetical protein
MVHAESANQKFSHQTAPPDAGSGSRLIGVIATARRRRAAIFSGIGPFMQVVIGTELIPGG